MFDKNDIKVLKGMFSKQDKIFDKKFEKLDKKIEDVRSDLRDEMHDMEKRHVNRMDAGMASLEHRLVRRMDTLRDDIAEILDTTVLPQIAELQRHTGLA